MRSGDIPGPNQQGFTYLALMFAVAITGAMLTATGIVWSQASQRDREVELLFIGNQFRQAIALYYQRTPGTVKRYPQKIDDLIEDRRYLTTQRYLRKFFADPMTGKAEWGFVMAPDGGIMGVYSLSAVRPIKNGGFAQAEDVGGFAKATSYADWRFTYAPIIPSQATPHPSALPAPQHGSTPLPLLGDRGNGQSI